MESIASILRNAGLKATPARLFVLRLLAETTKPLSHAEIEALARKEADAPPDRVTLYRVLEALTAAGLATKAVDRRGVARFSARDTHRRHERHVHFHCLGCGGVFCLTAPPPKPPRLPKGFRLEAAEFDVKGTCAQCAAKGKSGA
ncbi:MAG: transcriptional repressor [Rhodocyclaceae bacterium]|nr:transcriptional repressor [Rhodocyclaceae bacterium]